MEEDKGRICFLGGNNSSRTKKCQGSHSGDGGEMASEAKRYLDNLSEGSGEMFPGEAVVPDVSEALRQLVEIPEFLCDYHFSFCDIIPPSCIQMRNIVLSAFPHKMRLPDPSTSNLKRNDAFESREIFYLQMYKERHKKKWLAERAATIAKKKGEQEAEKAVEKKLKDKENKDEKKTQASGTIDSISKVILKRSETTFILFKPDLTFLGCSSTLFFGLLLGGRVILLFFILPEGFDPLALIVGFTPIEVNKDLLESLVLRESVCLGMLFEDVTGKNVVKTFTSKPSATIAPGMFKLDIEPISHRLKNNRDAHEVYLEKCIENIDTLRGLVECARKQNPSEPLLESTCMFTKHVQELLVYVSKTCSSLTKPTKKLVAVTPMNKDKKVSVIAKEHAVISVSDDEETLILKEKIRSQMVDKHNDPISIE
nr:CCR4-Not transcription complex subunit 1 isoform X2 [Tanacetum cinerariifolium]